jgi:polyisoprenyl-phosphate glycosyltransferase
MDIREIPSKNLISIVFSFRNEEKVIPELLNRLQTVLKPLPFDYEVIFVNDASTDNSLALLLDISNKDKRIKIINMSRRFGFPECAIAGIKHAKGNAVIYMDADLQDPPELIPQLIEKWLQGADVVYTVRTSREGESNFKRSLTKLAYRIINFSSDDTDLVVEAGNYKLLSRRVKDELCKLNEKSPYLRGLVRWVGFKQVPVYYKRQKRYAGETHSPLFRNIFRDFLSFRGPVGTLIVGITSFSILPLILFLLIGFIICFGAFLALLVVIILKYRLIEVSNFSGLTIAVFFLSGIQLIGIGTLGLYLARIYQEVKNRPNYVIESSFGFDEVKER